MRYSDCGPFLNEYEKRARGRKPQRPTFLATVLLFLTRPLESIINETPAGAVSDVAVQIDTSSLRAQREERASPLKPNVRIEFKSEYVSSFDV